MRKVTQWITAVLAAFILLYSYHANLAGTTGKTGDTNTPCATGIGAAANAGCAGHVDKPGESK
jgi:hypothetical protein